jgi:golgi pH regulator
MEELNWSVIPLSWLSFFCFSYIFVHYYLFKDFELRGRFLQLLFSVTFSTSCILLELFLLELSSFHISSLVWQTNLLLFSLLMLYLIPFFLAYKLIRTNYLFWLVFLLSYYYLLNLNWYFIDHEATTSLHFSLVEQIKLLGINGLVISAFLSGFGAINCTYAYFNFFNEDILKVNLKELVENSKKNIESLVEAKAKRFDLKKNNQKTWKNFWGVMQDKSEMEEIQREITSFEVIHHQYLKEINEIIKNQEKQQLRNSAKGKLYYLLGRVLTVYSVYKIIMSAVNYIFRRRYSLDPISRSFQVLCYFWDISPEIIEFATTYLSFGFIGVLIFTNIRSFLLLLISVINMCSRLISTGLSKQILMAIIAEVTGAYFMASVLLMRANLPEEKRQSLTNALPGVDFNSFHHIFDAVFTVSAIITAFLIYLKHHFSHKSKTA